MKKMVLGKSPSPSWIPSREIPTHQTPTWKTLPQKIATQKILTELFPPISFIAFLHLTLRFDKFS